MFIYVWSVSIFIVVFMFWFLTFFISYSYKSGYLSKTTSFECGFSPFSQGGFTFTMPFFLVSLMFLLFDVEIILLSFYPLGGVNWLVYSNCWAVLFMVFGATLYEWVKGVLGWFFSYLY